jgi:Na+-transporting methylmalonyl-CoA/oxaloacetate decarboxylase gamma subunit
MLNESILIMAVGMGSVFIFLGVLVISLQISARFFADWPLDEQPKPKKIITKPKSQYPDEDILIAIALAAIRHQETQT